MRDSALVISTEKELARVKVSPEIPCDQCSAHVFCQKQSGENGIMIAMNPLHALPGDEVKIEVPEANYNKEILLIFGAPLAASLFGLAIGYLAASLFHLPLSATSLLVLLLAVGLSAVGLFRRFRSQKSSHLYPLITDITKKGDSHE